ncbi:hypothetical protein [Joostella sp. CR20]|uniref:hypothetical protein n=1 Tax=Joostella sp. CR20 TaxID=2804312 RepID=UPI00313E6BA0
MNKRTKIQAFTISELIVVMIITVIVIGLAYSILSLVQSHMKGISYNLENTTELNLIKQALTYDFNVYSQAEVKQSGTILFKNELDSIIYTHEENILIRELDTFNVTTKSVDFFLDNKVITFGRFNAIKLILNLEGKETEIFIYQPTDAKTYIN